MQSTTIKLSLLLELRISFRILAVSQSGSRRRLSSLTAISQKILGWYWALFFAVVATTDGVTDLTLQVGKPKISLPPAYLIQCIFVLCKEIKCCFHSTPLSIRERLLSVNFPRMLLTRHRREISRGARVRLGKQARSRLTIRTALFICSCAGWTWMSRCLSIDNWEMEASPPCTHSARALASR